MLGINFFRSKNKVLLGLSGVLAALFLVLSPKNSAQAVLVYSPDGKVYDYNQTTNTLTPQGSTTAPATTPPSTTSSSNKDSVFLLQPLIDFFEQHFNDPAEIRKKAGQSEQGLFEQTVKFMWGDQYTIKAALEDARQADGRIDYSKVKIERSSLGMMGMLGGYTQAMIDNPLDIHAKTYFAELAPFKVANAASGIDAIAPPAVISYWAAMRNIAYALFLIVLVAIGFMIMFRSKIDPRTTVTVTAALPNIVVSLILITFSLTLAGLLVDLGSVLNELVKNILSGQNLLANANFVSTRPLDIFSTFVLHASETPLGKNFNDLPLIGGLGNILFTLVIATISIFIAFSIFFTLVFRWASILIKTIIAPLAFLLGALPGGSGTTSSWFKGFLVDVLTFPVVLFILNLANQILNLPSTALPFPPALGGTGSAGSGNYAPFVALGILLLATKVPHMLEEALNIKPSRSSSAGPNLAKAVQRTPMIGKFLG